MCCLSIYASCLSLVLLNLFLFCTYGPLLSEIRQLIIIASKRPFCLVSLTHVSIYLKEINNYLFNYTVVYPLQGMKHPANFGCLQYLNRSTFFEMVCSHFGQCIPRFSTNTKRYLPKKIFWNFQFVLQTRISEKGGFF